MRLEKDGITLRDLTDNDAEYLLDWLTDQRVLEFYEGRDSRFTMESIREHFFSSEETLHRCLIELEGKAVGYLQYYPLSTQEEIDEYQYEGSERPIYAIDQFIGIPEQWGRGLGTRFVSLLLSYLAQIEGAQAVLLDPHTNNPRAVRCYERCGFQKVKCLSKHELHEGAYLDCWLMCWKPAFESCKGK